MHDLVVRLVYKALIPASTAIAYNDTPRVRTRLWQLGPLSACRAESHVTPKWRVHEIGDLGGILTHNQRVKSTLL